MSLRRLFSAGLVASLLAVSGAGQGAGSPFQRTGRGQPAEAAPSEAFEFNGLMVAGNRTLVCVTELPQRRSHWIAVGAQAEGIKVTDYDPQARQIVVEAAGRSHRIGLRQPAAGTGAAPATGGGFSAPLPMAPTAAHVPVTNEEKEREARFLVSDLLEIGMIQRKAYEEAQKKGKAQQPAPPPPPPKQPKQQ